MKERAVLPVPASYVDQVPTQPHLPHSKPLMVEGIFFLHHGGQFALWPSPWPMRLLGVKFRKLSHNKAWLLRFVWVFKIAILGFKIQCGLPSLGILAIAVPVPSLANGYFRRIGDRWNARICKDTISKLANFKVLSHYIYLDILDSLIYLKALSHFPRYLKMSKRSQMLIMRRCVDLLTFSAFLCCLPL